MTAKRIRNLFGTVWLATVLTLPWVGMTLPENPTNATLNMCSIHDGQLAEPRTEAAPLWLRRVSLSPPPAEMCPQQSSGDVPATAAPEDTPIALPDAERPATVENLRRGDGR